MGCGSCAMDTSCKGTIREHNSNKTDYELEFSTEEAAFALASTETKSVERLVLSLLGHLQNLLNIKQSSGQRTTSSAKIVSGFGGGSGIQQRAQILCDTGRRVLQVVEQFAFAGKQVADENPQLAAELGAACRDASEAGRAIACLTSVQQQVGTITTADAARQLVQAVIRALALGDRAVVLQLLSAGNRACVQLSELGKCGRFIDFMPAFAALGEELVELGQLSGERQAEVKCEAARCRLAHTRSALEKAVSLVLTSSKLHLRHPDNPSAQRLRADALAHMRRCLDGLAEAAQPMLLREQLRLVRLRRQRQRQLLPELGEAVGALTDRQIAARLTEDRGLICEALSVSDAITLSSPSESRRRLEPVWQRCAAVCGLVVQLRRCPQSWTAAADWLEYHLQALGSMLLTATKATGLLTPDSKGAAENLDNFREAWRSAVVNEFGHLLLTVLDHLELQQSEDSGEIIVPEQIRAVRSSSPDGYENVTPPLFKSR